MSADDGFVARWSRRKALVRDGRVVEEASARADARPGDEAHAREQAPAVPAAAPAAAPLPVPPVDATPAATAEPHRAPPPTLDDVAALTRDADFSRFVAPGVDDGVKRAALTKLFSDPHFNVMDGLDTYIDDYNRAEPLPASALRKMAQSAFLGLFREDDENPDLQLQPDDAARRPGAEPGAAAGSGRGDDPA